MSRVQDMTLGANRKHDALVVRSSADVRAEMPQAAMQ